MKTMNYLFALLFLFVLSACSTENPTAELDLQSTDFKSELLEERTIYLELDLHQIVLQEEIRELQLDLLQIEEEIENSEGFVSEELQGRLERVQRMIEENRFNFEENNEVISEYRGPRGPGGSGNPCGENDAERCDLDLENAIFYIFRRPEIDSKKKNDNETCGELVDLVEVPEYEGEVSKAIYEEEEGCANEIEFSGIDANGNKFSYSISIAQ